MSLLLQLKPLQCGRRLMHLLRCGLQHVHHLKLKSSWCTATKHEKAIAGGFKWGDILDAIMGYAAL